MAVSVCECVCAARACLYTGGLGSVCSDED